MLRQGRHKALLAEVERNAGGMSMKRLTMSNGDGTVSQPTSTTVEAVFYRLSAIEDILGDTYDLSHLRELVEADREGRCEIHAVKDGETVFSIFAFVNGLHIRKSNGEPLSKIASYKVDDFTRNTVYRELGKTVFLTREAAETAIKTST